MISAKALSEDEIRDLVCHDLTVLAPAFRLAVAKSINDCHGEGLDPKVYETRRSNEVQSAYYALGRTVIPPHYTVTNAKDASHSWHMYGLAVDVISAKSAWEVTPLWMRLVAAHFKANGCAWGGDWTHPDFPHYQWGRCRATPSDEARRLYAEGGSEAVWEAVGAL